MRYFEVLLKVPGSLSKVGTRMGNEAPVVGTTVEYLAQRFEVLFVREIMDPDEWYSMLEEGRRREMA